jgi:glycosyltransferase involved in cell wall biosynthesis
MILAVDCREFVSGRMTGIGSFLGVLLRYLASQHSEVSVTALVEVDMPALPFDFATHVHRLPKAPTLISDQWLIPQALGHLGADVFFSPYYKVPFYSPCPTVATIHDLIPVLFPDYLQGASAPRAALLRVWTGLLAGRADAVVTDSEFSKAQLQSTLRLSAERIHAIPIGVPPEFCPNGNRPAQSCVASRYGIRPPYLLTIGNFLPHKNLVRLVEAYASLPEACRRAAALALAGAPGGHGTVRPVSRGSLQRPGVVFPGFIATEDLPSIFAGALALVFPSLVEGFGLPVLEAMSCGTPVICARAGSLPEVAGDAALYVDPLDTGSIRAGMEQIIQDADLRATLSARGLERAKLFDSRHTTARLVDLLERVARGEAA